MYHLTIQQQTQGFRRMLPTSAELVYVSAPITLKIPALRATPA